MKATCPDDYDKCPHANESAEIAVKKVFAILGVNVDVPRDIEEFRENLRFGAGLRRATDRGYMAMITIVAGGIIFSLWVGIKKALFA